MSTLPPTLQPWPWPKSKTNSGYLLLTHKFTRNWKNLNDFSKTKKVSQWGSEEMNSNPLKSRLYFLVVSAVSAMWGAQTALMNWKKKREKKKKKKEKGGMEEQKRKEITQSLAEISLMPWNEGKDSDSKGTDVWLARKWPLARQQNTHSGEALSWCGEKGMGEGQQWTSVPNKMKGHNGACSANLLF